METEVTNTYLSAFKEMVDSKANQVIKFSPTLYQYFIARSEELMERSRTELSHCSDPQVAHKILSKYYDQLSPYWNFYTN